MQDKTKKKEYTADMADSPGREEQRQRYELFFSQCEDGLLFLEMVDGESGAAIVDANPSVCLMLGYRREELLRMTLFDLLSEAERQTFSVNREILLREGRLRHERTLRARDGGPIDVEIVSRLVERDGRRLVMSSLRDISEYKRSREELKRSRELLAGAEALSHTGAWEWDLESDVMRFSDEWLAIHGCTKRTMTPEELLPLAHPDDLERVSRALEAVREGKSAYDIEHRIVRRDDHSVRYVHSRGRYVLNGQGRVVRVYGFAQDITERRQVGQALLESERRFRKALEIETVGVLFFDMKANFLEANDAFLRMIGYDRETLERGELNSGLVTLPEWMPRTYEAFDELVEIGRLSPYEKELVRPDGSRWWGLFAGTRLSENESVEFVLDVTDRKRAETALRSLNEQLEERVSERTEQLRGLAAQLSQAEQLERKRLAKILHDHLQQLIVAARMQVGVLESAGNPEETRTVAREVSQILKEAVDASRSLAVDLSPPVLHEAGLIGGLQWLASDLEKKHQFRIELEIEKTAEPAYEEMRIMLFESVRELLLNAVKHSGVSAAQVCLARTEGDRIQLIVSDRGRGFDPAVLKERRPDEVSFGLFSLQERLAHIGGQVLIESAPDKGTRITLTVPNGGVVKAAERITAVPEQPAMEEVVTVRHKSELCSILIVDDHKIMRQGLVKLFRTEPSIEVVGEAATGPEAIELAERLEPDVIIMDVNLGAMSGVEATRRILERRPATKVIGLSMHVDPSVAEAMLAAGACAYRTKSGPSEELIDAVRQCLEAD